MPTIKVLADDVLIHSVQTDASVIYMRGDGWKELGTFPVGPVAMEPPPVVVPPVEPPVVVTPPVVEPPPVVVPPVVVPPVVEPPVIVPPPPPTIPPVGYSITIQGGSLPRPTTTSDLQQLLNAAAINGAMCVLDPMTRVDLTQPVVVQCRGNDGSLWGLNGNGAKFIWKGAHGGDMLTFLGAAAGSDFQTNRGLMVKDLTLDGQGSAGSCLVVRATYGDQGSIYKSAVRDIYTFGATHGFLLEGAVFESYLSNVHAENHLGDGMVTRHAPDYQGRRNIISNINIIHPNFSRNKGAGLRCTYSTNLSFGSFVLNADGGVVAADGLRYAVGCNGENTGAALFDVQYKGYGSYLAGNEVSSDGQTVHRQFENGAWVTYGKPCLYILANVVGDIKLDGLGNHCSYYGGGTDPMRVVK